MNYISRLLSLMDESPPPIRAGSKEKSLHDSEIIPNPEFTSLEETDSYDISDNRYDPPKIVVNQSDSVIISPEKHENIEEHTSLNKMKPEASSINLEEKSLENRNTERKRKKYTIQQDIKPIKNSFSIEKVISWIVDESEKEKVIQRTEEAVNVQSDKILTEEHDTRDNKQSSYNLNSKDQIPAIMENIKGNQLSSIKKVNEQLKPTFLPLLVNVIKENTQESTFLMNEVENSDKTPDEKEPEFENTITIGSINLIIENEKKDERLVKMISSGKIPRRPSPREPSRLSRYYIRM